MDLYFRTCTSDRLCACATRQACNLGPFVSVYLSAELHRCVISVLRSEWLSAGATRCCQERKGLQQQLLPQARGVYTVHTQIISLTRHIYVPKNRLSESYM